MAAAAGAEPTLHGRLPTTVADAPITITIEAYAATAGVQQPLATWDASWNAGPDLSLPIDRTAHAITVDVARWRLGLRRDGFAPVWALAGSDGALRFSKPMPLAGGTVLTAGQVLLPSDAPRPFTTIWGDAKGTILGWCDGEGRFSVGVPAQGKGGSHDFVIYETDLIGGWYHTDGTNGSDKPLICRPRSALSAQVRLTDSYGTPIPQLEIRGGGGGGTRTDQDGVATVNSLFGDRPTTLWISMTGGAPPKTVVIDAHKPEVRAAVTSYAIDVGYGLVYQPEAGDVVFLSATGGPSYATCAMIAQEHGVWLACRGPGAVANVPFDSWIAAGKQRRFDAYRLAGPDIASRSALAARAAAVHAGGEAPASVAAVTAWIADLMQLTAAGTPDELAAKPGFVRVCALVRGNAEAAPTGF